jgi:coenzyme PQQ precursor peptide PqqA
MHTAPPSSYSGLTAALRGNHSMETAMTWETPCATDLRFGFEITMYIANR